MITVISIVAIVTGIVVVVIILEAVVVVVALLLLLEKSVNTLLIMTECLLAICHFVPTT